MTTTYEMIRGPKQAARCKCLGPYGSPLYCKCGCQTPAADDPAIKLSGIQVEGRAYRSYADHIISRNGVQCGVINTQYGALTLDATEYLGCQGPEFDRLIAAARNSTEPMPPITAGSTLAETAAQEAVAEKIDTDERDTAHANEAGYCTHCHTYCYGDCQA